MKAACFSSDSCILFSDDYFYVRRPILTGIVMRWPSR
jgi:hypothetical protein